MPIPKNFAATLDKPGKYCVKQAFYTWYCEVTPEKKIYQLRPSDMSRDGILSEDGWNVEQAEKATLIPLE